MFLRNIRSAISIFSPAFLAALALTLPGCNSLDNSGSTSSRFRQINLVADTEGFNAARIDPNLLNPWGIALGQSGYFWIADNHSGLGGIYDAEGNPEGTAVMVPGPLDDEMGAPTGVVANNTLDFRMPGGNIAAFLFAGEDGIVTGWNSQSGAAAVVLDAGDSEAVYKGLAIAPCAGRSFLYLANFKEQRVEAYDSAFRRDATKLFRDSTLPSDFGPFNIVAVDSQLYVAYAKLKAPENEDDEAGAGNGYIDVFTSDGVLIRRFASNGTLNSPWAITPITTPIGPYATGFFVGNFGDGTVSVFDTHGNIQGQVQDSAGNAVKIEGLWGLYGTDRGTLYFTAGPEDEEHGIFGYLKPL